MRSMASSPSSKGIAAIVGVGPTLGRSIARKFAHEGYTVAILARDLGQYRKHDPALPLAPHTHSFSLDVSVIRHVEETIYYKLRIHTSATKFASKINAGKLSRLADEIAREEKSQVFAIRIDCSDTRSIKEAFEGVLSVGFVEVLVYNAYQPMPWPPTHFTDITIDRFEKSVAISSVGAFHCAQQVLPGMADRRRGTILFTGCFASLNGIAGYSDLCCGKFALRALSQCLAREFQPLGVHVAHVIIDGIVGSPRAATASTSQHRSSVGEEQGGGARKMDPDVVAQTYWHLHIQDRSAWTQEIDLRPSSDSMPF